jgi:acetolactate synthase small subunit
VTKVINSGDCVKIPDGRIARDISQNEYIVRVRRKESKYHQFLKFSKRELTKVQCPRGWMVPEDYNRYVEKTLMKMKKRMK